MIKFVPRILIQNTVEPVKTITMNLVSCPDVKVYKFFIISFLFSKAVKIYIAKRGKLI